MASVYKVDFEVVSDFCNYSEKEIKELLKIKTKILNKENGSSLRIREVEVNQIA